MSDNLFNAFSEFDESVAQHVPTYSGLLGLPVSNKVVEVPNRNGYVYVRLRDNQNEIIQAYNEKVSAVYNLPVLVSRQGNRWVVVNRDIDRYENWGSDSAFLPAHAPQHEFDRDNPGGDIVFSYVDQLMPLLVYPSGTPGSSNVLVGGYNFKKNNSTWAYVGNTGTPSVLIYKPTDNQARMVLVYLDRTTGNPGLLINSGTSFAANLTGTHDVLQYLPSLTSTQEPLKAIRLVSGSTYVGWDNLYDIRQFFGGTSATSGGSGTPGGSDTQVQFNRSNAFGGVPQFEFDYTNSVLMVGEDVTPPSSNRNEIHLLSSGTSPGLLLWSAMSNSAIAPYIAGLRSRGSFNSPTAIDQFDEIFRIRARGYNGVNWTATQGLVLFDAPYAWVSGSHPVDISVWGTPSGSATLQQYAEFNPSGINLDTGKTYNINGSPHVHTRFIPFGTFAGIAPFSATGFPYVVTIDRNITLLTLAQSFQVTSANNGNDANNYWSIDFFKQATGGSPVLLVSIDTTGATVDTWTQKSVSSFTVSTASVGEVIYVRVIKAGATANPGLLYIAGPALEVSY